VLRCRRWSSAPDLISKLNIVHLIKPWLAALVFVCGLTTSGSVADERSATDSTSAGVPAAGAPVAGDAAPSVNATSLRADQLELNLEDGSQIATGNVIFISGTLEINADQLLVNLQAGAITRLVASGSPLTIVDKSNTSEALTVKASRVSYETRKWTLLASGGIEVSRGDWSLSGDQAQYNLRTKALQVKGDEDARLQMQLPVK